MKPAMLIASVLLGALWSCSLFSQALPPDCGKVTLVFGNGVHGADDADAYANDVKERFAKYAGSAVATTLTAPEVAANSSGGYLKDLIEVGRQEGYSEGSLWAVILGVARFAAPTVVKALGIVSTRLADPKTTETDVSTQIGRYRELVGNGRKVVVIAHSQGNYFSNAALDPTRANGLTADELKAIAVVPVGSPDYYATRSFVDHIRIGNGALGDVPDDEVIYWASVKRQGKGLAASLDANTADPYEGHLGDYLDGYDGTVVLDGWRHGFLDAYFYAGSDSENRILQHIADSLDKIQNPKCSLTPPTCSVAAPSVPCNVGTTTYDSFVGNYSTNRSFYRASSYDVSYENGQVVLTLKPNLPHTEGYAYVANYGPTVWTSPPPYSTGFGSFGPFNLSGVRQADHFEWLGVGSGMATGLLSYEISGTVTHLNDSPGRLGLFPSLALGDSFTLRFSVDLQSPMTLSTVTTAYPIVTASIGKSGVPESFATILLDPNPFNNRIDVFNFSKDGVHIWFTAATIGGESIRLRGITMLTDSTGTVFDSTALPINPPTMARFDSAGAYPETYFVFEFGGPASGQVASDIYARPTSWVRVTNP